MTIATPPSATAPADRPRRSVLYVPASNPRAIAKAPSLGADAIVYDLEDAVAPSARPAARAALVAALDAGAGSDFERVVRINSSPSDDFEADLDAVARGRPDAILLPKVESDEDLLRVAEASARLGVPPTTALWAMVETAAAVIGLDAIARTGLGLMPRLDVLVVGTNDLAKETGVYPGESRHYLMPWLMQVVLVARRHRLSVLDGVWNDFADTAGFETEARQSVRMAFDGKTLIHPSQITPANRLFSPDPAALVDAERIVAAFALPEHRHANVINLDGRMVERLHFEQAQRLLAKQARIAARGPA